MDGTQCWIWTSNSKASSQTLCWYYLLFCIEKLLLKAQLNISMCFVWFSTKNIQLVFLYLLITSSVSYWCHHVKLSKVLLSMSQEKFILVNTYWELLFASDAWVKERSHDTRKTYSDSICLPKIWGFFDFWECIKEERVLKNDFVTESVHVSAAKENKQFQGYTQNSCCWFQCKPTCKGESIC